MTRQELEDYRAKGMLLDRKYEMLVSENDIPLMEIHQRKVEEKRAERKAKEENTKNSVVPTGENEGIISPAGYKSHTSIDGGTLNLPSSVNPEIFSSSKNTQTPNTKINISIKEGSVRAFNIDGKRYVATYNNEGKFVGYKNFADNSYYISPKSLSATGTISKFSFGETSGLYPLQNTANPPNSEIYNPEKWDYDTSQELLEARAAINLISSRNSKLRSNTPKSTGFEKTITPWHIIANFPAVDKAIKNDDDVKYFFLSPDIDAKHTGLNYNLYDITNVKTYGPFYNNGGGDVPKGKVYIHFYKAILKK
jgi:hypothetical protein